MAISKYQDKIKDVKNEKIKKSLTELTRVFRVEMKKIIFLCINIFNYSLQMYKAEEIKRITVW